MTKDISKEIEKINEKYNIDLLSLFGGSASRSDCFNCGTAHCSGEDMTGETHCTGL
ncbi:hypothetical protein DCO58_03450 [Helicobacter saguini]|uniref:Uncharacterized protein n=1 Tax=Helicobacter saguini TaxID=1548018 RepID=A0A6B0HQD6_9HELI|nr:hypothetical protein [Helicobacter saguini]MWV62573.1 hypothetical protein [Helicobacter saguini]MWV66753.1 hypothetical protein [Helicobacter saguini]MWV69104.1 hypothetical protein [Helicobacter saguini]MWV71341.1 hypothetical protein [Helicobacter saguini]